MADWVDVQEDEWADVPEGGAEGGGGSDKAPSKQLQSIERLPMGTPRDFARRLADVATLEGAPQVEGAMAALLQGAQNSAMDEAEAMGSPSLTNQRPNPADAYREV